MGWIIFATYFIAGIFYQLFNYIEKTSPHGSKERKIASLVMTGIMILCIIGVAVLALYALGWIWYFFCGGFLIFEDQPFWDKVVCGLISLIPLGFFIGIIMVLFGWNPDK